MLILEKGKFNSLAKITKRFGLRFKEKISCYVQKIVEQGDSITNRVIHMKYLLDIATYQ